MLTVNPLLSPPGGLFFSSTFEGGLFNLATGARFLEDGLVVPGRYTALSNDKKMLTILHRELERKVEKVKHIKLKVMHAAEDQKQYELPA